MLNRAAYVWPLVSFGLATALLFIATNDARSSVLGGANTCFFAFATALAVSRHWRRRADAFAAAARGLQVEPLEDAPNDPDNPTNLAREVQSTAESARETGRQLAVLRAVVDGMAEGVWITGEDGTVLQHNSALKEMLYSGQELVGQRPVELLRSAELQEAVEKACREGLPSRLELPVEGVRPRVLSIHVSPLGRELGGSAAVFFDVTELRRLEKVRKDFVANVSHELRTPITAIRGYSETLMSGALNDASAAPKMVDIIHRQSERLSELVEDLLELSRIESKQLQLAQEPVELAEAAQRASEAVRPKARARNTTIDLQIDPGLSALADQRALEQVLLNLLDNAVKYTPPSGHVWVSAKRREHDVQVAIRDDGPGIEPRHLPRIFERFYRVDKGRSRDMGGTGLGLSIVKHLVTGMKGEVRVESAPGKGSTFFVELPAAKG
jgi:two-component system phosphate regulon sensor histidine kinase PhoR